jgi:ABC-type nitrate/sulfonate/bicarbonate transport system substrate-binding protein
MKNPATHVGRCFALVLCTLILLPSLGHAQTKLRNLTVPYPLGGSTSYFWVAYRAGAFEKYGLRIQPIYVRGGRAAVQALLAGEAQIEMQGGSTGISAWGQGAKDLVFIGAVGNKLDYVFVTSPKIKKPEDLKGKRIAISQLGASTDFIARLALRQLGLNSERDAILVGAGGAGERWTALNAGQVDASLFQPPFTLLARKAGFPVLIDFSKSDFQYSVSAVLTTRSFIRAEPETVMNFMRGLADGMDFYRDENNREKVIHFLGDYYRSKATEELEETRRVYSQVTPGLPYVTAKAIENVIVNDKSLAGLGLKAEDMLDLSFLRKLEEERKAKGR